ncbi:pyroglutamyl-peptidase I [Hyphomicrobium sulfonivorans]|uniref:pyroglutamyl-peptidase I family protein n=1 Tax=Hyphomicrobium sulfonivorans TaxID=121290 RepID=UPI00157137B8|nr:pyroglutamyl-peptidase I [Hyphomicrobium sulfonivorans]NSL71716.1 peptidase C15 [Hyphomicrobium sulfonivorans]
MTQSRLIILLTGFGAFPGVAHNVTADFVPKLAKSARALFADYDIVTEILPVAWERGPLRLGALLNGNAPVLALHFGVASASKGFRIELTGRNVCAPRPDADGALPPLSSIIAGGAASIAATLPVDDIVSRLKIADVPCCTSNDAGDYLCNAILYQSLTTAALAERPFMAGFIHMPEWLSEASGPFEDGHLTWNGALAGGLEMIATCLEAIEGDGRTSSARSGIRGNPSDWKTRR